LVALEPLRRSQRAALTRKIRRQQEARP
jgi:hypothetical protein